MRDATDPVKTDFLRHMPGFVTGRLTLHSCDLSAEGVFDEVFSGCHGVCHVGADLGGPNDERVALYQNQTRNIIGSINRSRTVGRLIYTSSTAAVSFSGTVNEEGLDHLIKAPVLYEDRDIEAVADNSFRQGDALKVSGYSVGKVTTEKIVADAGAASGGRWDAIICNPADNIGPILSPHHEWTGWQHTIGDIVAGKPFPQTNAYRPWQVVDVRDCAAAHIALLESVMVQSGQRYIAWSTDKVDVEHDIAATIAKLFPGMAPSLKSMDQLPQQQKDREHEFRSIWRAVDMRNDRIKSVSQHCPSGPAAFRPFETTLRDCVESLILIGGVKPAMKPKL